MTITKNDKLYRQVMKSIKARQELAQMATTESEVIEHENKIRDLLAMARTLNDKL